MRRDALKRDAVSRNQPHHSELGTQHWRLAADGWRL